MAANAHNSALKQTFVNTPRVQHLSALMWNVDIRAEVTWVLGDVGCVAKHFNDDVLNNALNGSNLELEAICLPVSDRALLVGRSCESEFQFVPEHVNRASTELSQDFFVSSVDTERERGLRSYLGRRSQLISREEIMRIVADEM